MKDFGPVSQICSLTLPCWLMTLDPASWLYLLGPKLWSSSVFSFFSCTSFSLALSSESVSRVWPPVITLVQAAILFVCILFRLFSEEALLHSGPSSGSLWTQRKSQFYRPLFSVIPHLLPPFLDTFSFSLSHSSNSCNLSYLQINLKPLQYLFPLPGLLSLDCRISDCTSCRYFLTCHLLWEAFLTAASEISVLLYILFPQLSFSSQHLLTSSILIRSHLFCLFLKT